MLFYVNCYTPINLSGNSVRGGKFHFGEFENVDNIFVGRAVDEAAFMA
jgi:hypothetical protein